MSTSTSFQLDPIPPSARLEAIETNRRKTREKVAAFRKRQKAAGSVRLTVFIPRVLAEYIDSERTRRKLRGRADAVISLFSDLPSPRVMDRMLVSVSSDHASLLDALAAAKGLKNRSAAIEMVIDTILANPALKQELGL